MTYMGGDEACIHGTQVTVTASLLTAGRDIDEVVQIVLEATLPLQAITAHDGIGTARKKLFAGCVCRGSRSTHRAKMIAWNTLCRR